MKKLLSILLAALLVFSLCACGSSSNSGAASATTMYNSDAYAPSYELMEEDYGGFSVTSESASVQSDAPQENPEKIIYSSSVTVETTDFETTIAGVEELVKQYGGWIESSSVNGANFYDSSRGYTRNRSASYSLRIPSARFDELMGSLSTLGNIPYSHTYTENVTSQYYDVQARLTAYTTQETRLLEMMELAESVEDVIIIEDRLTELRYQIESLQSALNNWDRRVSYSSVYLDISEVREYTPEPEVKLSYGQQLLQALTGGLKGVGNFFKDFLVILAACLPALLVIGAILAVILLCTRKRRAQRKETRAAKKAAKQAKKEEKQNKTE